MRAKISLGVVLCAFAGGAFAAPAADSAPRASRVVKAVVPQVAQPAQFDEYLQLHHDSGYAVLVAPFSDIALDRRQPSCAKAHAATVDN